MTVIKSATGNKEAQIVHTSNVAYCVTILQVVNTGIGIERDFVIMKSGISTYTRAEKWALKNL